MGGIRSLTQCCGETIRNWRFGDGRRGEIQGYGAVALHRGAQDAASGPKPHGARHSVISL
jgi:hypothetical protein